MTNLTATGMNPNGQFCIANPGDALHVSSVALDKIITPAGTTGNQTIQAQSGSVNLAGGQTQITVNNSLVTTNSLVFISIANNDSDIGDIRYQSANGSFTVFTVNAPANETRIAFFIMY
jgi:hypothetical protein